jgi:hypothetical protein
MSLYLTIDFLGDYCDVDVEYDVIEGDDSVGLPVDYEFSVSYMDEDGNEVDITDELTPFEIQEVYAAIEEDLKRDDY